MNIGDRIKNRRHELGLSADDVAAKIGKNRATVYRYESNEIENLPLSTLEPLAKVLNTTPAYLIGWSDDKNETVDNFTHAVIDSIQNATVLPSKTRYIYEDGEDDKLEDLFYSLNASGRKKAIEQLELLAKIPEYSDNNIQT